MVSYIRSDLDFILTQIKISEADAAFTQGISTGDPLNPAKPLFGPGGSIPTYNLSWGLRTVDGSFNHLLPGQEQWGASNNQFPSLMEPVYRPADGTPFDPDGPGPAPAMPTAPNYNPSNNPNSLVFDSSLRTISNLLVDQTLGNPAAVLTALQNAGSANEMADLAAVNFIYQVFKPAWDAEYQARVVMQNAKAAAEALGDGNPATPPTLEEQSAIDAWNAATAAHATTVTALEAARGVRDAALDPFGIAMQGDNVHLPNTAPDVGLSAPFNSWFTLFGQFFDHGLDLVNKGGSGTVFIPLQPDDPLYVEGSNTNFMVLTRATTSPGADGVFGDNPATPQDESADDVRPVNTTTAHVDQNQTYTSHSSHQVFLRQYEINAAGDPVATGKLIEGANGGMATWGEVKAQARTMLGIDLTDNDVGSVPLLRTDAYGNFIPGANGMPQLITGVGADGIPNTDDDAVLVGNLATPVSTATALRTPFAFLADIAHEAVPVGKIADGDITIGLANPGNGDAEYDNELLDAHFIAGDGRANENIGLTAVHHVFHAEHNRLVEHTKDTVLATNDLAFINEWLVDDLLALPTTPAEVAGLVWDGERLFQAAKFGTEMQYQHLVFEEFARKVTPSVNAFIVPDGFETSVNPSIVAEFAHVVYRFGHSMLTESIDRFDPNFNQSDIGLIEGFLNPVQFDSNHTITDGVAAGAIIRGMTRQAGNEIDEFVTTALRNNLLGLPLDLATINLARGRDTGVPSLNEARSQFYQATNQDVQLKPYDSWTDFAGHLKHEASIINFVAAYGTHPLIEAESTIEGKRAAAFAIVFGTPQIVSGPETTGVAWTGPEGVAWIGLATPASSIDENILVDDAYYNFQNPDVLAAGIDPDLHFALFGAAEGRRPNQFSNFDGARYLAENPDVAAAGMDPLVHFLAFGRFEGRLFYSVAIDENIMVEDTYYNLTNPDVLANGMDPDLHFALFGAAEGRNPNQFFDAAYYLANNPGVTGNLLEHYSTTGWLSGQNPSANFDGARYLAQNPDVAAAGMNPLLHFLAFGRFEGRLSYPVSVGVVINPPADRLDFLNATGAYAGGTLGGLNTVDLWIGGLAEEIMPFGGMLGSTFQFVFENQMESLQNGDRFYYLQRLDGLHLFGELEANSFASLIMRNTDATHLPSDVFSMPGLILEVDPARQFNDLDGNGTLEGGDPVGAGILTELVIRNNPGTPGTDTNYLRYTGPEHVVLGGTDPGSLFNPTGNDILIGSEGDDTLHGDGGNDRLEGGFGNDIFNGGAGDDIITDVGGDDNVKGGDGNDAIHAGLGLDLVLGGEGQDFIVLGTDDAGEAFGGVGNDFIHADSGAERILGNEGNDWLEGGAFSGAPGDNFDEIFARDGIDGNDVFLGEAGFDEFIGEGGDDIMVGSLGRGTMAGMSGFDWATYKDFSFGVNANLGLPIIFDENPTIPADSALERYESVEGLSGSRFNDILLGTNDTVVEMGPIPAGGAGGFLGSYLDAEGIALINGLQDLLGGATAFTSGDIILGGDGSDVITGLAGDDVIDGDKWLDVQIGVFDAGDPNHIGTPSELHSSMASLTQQVFSGDINPGRLSIVRTIRDSNDQPDSDGIADVDVAVFSGAMADYDFAFNPDMAINVTDTVGTDGTDTLRNIEQLQFLDTSVDVVVGTAAADTLNGTAGNDFIIGLGGADVMDGGAGNDTYVFTSAADANGDSILTFEVGDRVDLTAIDANSGVGGNQSFTLTNGSLTGLAGELAFTFDVGANVTVVQGDIDGDAAADFSFGISGNQTLTPGNTGL